MKTFENRVTVSELYVNILDLARSYNLDINYKLKVRVMDSLDVCMDDYFKSDEWSFDDYINKTDAELILGGFEEEFEAFAERSDK